MTKQEINLIIERNKEFKVEGRYEGAMLTLIGMTFYLIIIALILN